MKSKFTAGWRTPTELRVKLFDSKEEACAHLAAEMNRAADIAFIDGDIERVSVLETAAASYQNGKPHSVILRELEFWVDPYYGSGTWKL